MKNTPLLEEGEKILWMGKPRFWVFFAEDGMIVSVIGFLWLFSSLAFSLFSSFLRLQDGALFFSAYAVFGLFLLVAPAVWALWELTSIQYVVTDRRVLVTGGILKRTTESLERNDIEAIKQVDDLADKTLGHHSASIELYPVGPYQHAGKNFLALKHVSAPHEVMQILAPETEAKTS